MLSGDGRWKLYFPHTYRSLEGRPGRDDGQPIPYNYGVKAGLELYDLQTDIGEATDVIRTHATQVEAMQALADSCRMELGDALTDKIGRGLRHLGILRQ